MVIDAGAFILYRPSRRSLLSVTTELLSLAFLLPLAKTDRETQTHRWSRSSHHFERRTAATVASTSSDLEVRRETKQPILNVIQRQLGHANLGITSVYLQGIDNSEIIETVSARAAPMLPASAGLH
jgi:hypothetical protein